MPNHVINRLEFECSEERLKELLSAICYDNNAIHHYYNYYSSYSSFINTDMNKFVLN